MVIFFALDGKVVLNECLIYMPMERGCGFKGWEKQALYYGGCW